MLPSLPEPRVAPPTESDAAQQNKGPYLYMDDQGDA